MPLGSGPAQDDAGIDASPRTEALRVRATSGCLVAAFTTANRFGADRRSEPTFSTRVRSSATAPSHGTWFLSLPRRYVDLDFGDFGGKTEAYLEPARP